MKTNFLLPLVSFFLTVAASAASTSTTATTAAVAPEPAAPTVAYRLETYRVVASRQTDAEQSIQQGLAEFQTAVLVPVAVRIQPVLPLTRFAPVPEAGKVAGRPIPPRRNQT